MTAPFDLDVSDRALEALSPRERLVRLVPQLDDTDCSILAHQARDFIRARRLHRDQLAREEAERRGKLNESEVIRIVRKTPSARLVGPERAEFLEEP